MFQNQPKQVKCKNKFREIQPKDTTNKNIFPSAKINSTKCAKFWIFDLFHYLSKVSNNNLYRIRKKKEQIQKIKKNKQKNKQIVTERQILKTLNIMHCTLQTIKAGYTDNEIFGIVILDFCIFYNPSENLELEPVKEDMWPKQQLFLKMILFIIKQKDIDQELTHNLVRRISM